MARPDQVFNTVASSILVFILLLPVDAQDPGNRCVSEIRLRKNTVYTVSSGSMLNISCPVIYCNDAPLVKWFKIDNETKYIQINKTNQISITQKETDSKTITSQLSIRNISTDDNGIYRCVISLSNVSSESHNIKVIISDSMNHTDEKSTKEEKDEKLSYKSWFLYVFICFGILGLVMVVMLTSFMCINRCSRKSNSRRFNNVPVCTNTSGKSQELPDEQNNIYDAPTDDSRSRPDSLCASNDREYAPDMRKGNQHGDVLQQIVYATIQHPAPQENPAVQQVSTEQLVEYASIRIA